MPKPKLTKTQLEDLSRMKASTYYGDGGYAYVEVDNRGWKPYTTRPVQALLKKGIITIPKNENRSFYGRVESMEAYIVHLNPIAWEYPFKYDYDKSLSQVGDKIVENAKIKKQEDARMLQEKRDYDNLTEAEVYRQLFGAEEFGAEGGAAYLVCDGVNDNGESCYEGIDLPSEGWLLYSLGYGKSEVYCPDHALQEHPDYPEGGVYLSCTAKGDDGYQCNESTDLSSQGWLLWSGGQGKQEVYCPKHGEDEHPDYYAEEFGAEERKKCPECEAETVGSEEVDYCGPCGEKGHWGEGEPVPCPECGIITSDRLLLYLW